MSDEPAIVTVATNPLLLVARYLDRADADPSKLERLADLVEWHEKREAERAEAVAEIACQREMPVVVRDADNSRTGKKYARVETIQESIRQAMLKHGFSLSWSQGDAPWEGWTRVLCVRSHISGHKRTYQGDYPLDGKGAKGGSVMNDLQGVVSAHTYAQKDMLRLMWNITIADKDRDGESNGNGTINGDQIAAINDLLAACEKKGEPFAIKDVQRFLAFAINCAMPTKDESPLSLAEVPAARFTAVVTYLTSRLANGPSKPQTAKGAAK